MLNDLRNATPSDMLGGIIVLGLAIVAWGVMA